MMMQKIKIGAVTIGQSPRTDITEDAGRFFGDRVELLEFGALDRYTPEEAKQLQPIPGDYGLTSRLRDGTEVHFSRGQVMEEMQRGIHLLEERGVKLILVFCTGALHGLHSNVPMLEPNQLLRAMAPLLTQKPRILTLTPSETQVQQCERRWKEAQPDFEFTTFPASPYLGDPFTEELVSRINAVEDADLVIMDCLGFSGAMRDRLQARINKNILLPRSLLFRVACELLGI